MATVSADLVFKSHHVCNRDVRTHAQLQTNITCAWNDEQRPMPFLDCATFAPHRSFPITSFDGCHAGI
eukprot:5075222-Lingulodinium_polyedra.AAC.1